MFANFNVASSDLCSSEFIGTSPPEPVFYFKKTSSQSVHENNGLDYRYSMPIVLSNKMEHFEDLIKNMFKQTEENLLQDAGFFDKTPELAKKIEQNRRIWNEIIGTDGMSTERSRYLNSDLHFLNQKKEIEKRYQPLNIFSLDSFFQYNDNTDDNQFEYQEHNKYKLVSDIEKLEDGWAGPDTVAPNPIVTKALNHVFTSLNWEEEKLPEVQIDESDGMITMMWYINDENMCSIDILYDGTTVCSVTDLVKTESDCKIIEPSDHQAMYDFFNLHNAIL